jgi:hypothetical protein
MIRTFLTRKPSTPLDTLPHGEVFSAGFYEKQPFWYMLNRHPADGTFVGMSNTCDERFPSDTMVFTMNQMFQEITERTTDPVGIARAFGGQQCSRKTCCATLKAAEKYLFFHRRGEEKLYHWMCAVDEMDALLRPKKSRPKKKRAPSCSESSSIDWTSTSPEWTPSSPTWSPMYTPSSPVYTPDAYFTSKVSFLLEYEFTNTLIVIFCQVPEKVKEEERSTPTCSIQQGQLIAAEPDRIVTGVSIKRARPTVKLYESSSEEEDSDEEEEIHIAAYRLR